MSLPVLVDMNLSIEWVDRLTAAGWPEIHWSSVGAADSKDQELMAWAATHRHVVFTHDLDFGTALALTRASEPSVVQVRGPKVLPEHIGDPVLAALGLYEQELAAGALVVVEESRSRVRVLPF